MAIFDPTPTSNRSKRRYIVITAVACFCILALLSLRNPTAAGHLRRPFQNAGILSTTTSAPQDDRKLSFQALAEAQSKLTPQERGGYVHPNESSYTTTLVMGRLKADVEKAAWVHTELSNISDTKIYIVDDAESIGPHLLKNHGREGMVYIKYIIDNYDNLNDITFFWHTDAMAWHNNYLLGQSSARTINTMNREQIIQDGYVPSRCDHWPGCPSWIIFNPSIAEHTLDHHKLSDMFTPFEFGRMFPGEDDFPRYFAQTCCSQFAVSRQKIRSVPKEEYERVKEWITNYESDQLSGRALEILWQYLFLRKGTYCPSMFDCYCKTYGICIEDKKEITMIERWNEFRTRQEELNFQRMNREEALRQKGWSELGTKKFQDDWEWDRLAKDQMLVRGRYDAYSGMIIHHWDLPKTMNLGP
ncbi:MAG: hypothetical protein M1828_003144 [Chrysothrix sp. TS-e1954]|nr:MAG: hypothetical protein M1828_003144 [Chrysothrix sp. TS-e1954]